MQKRYIAAAGAALMTLTIGLAGCSSDTESTAAAETTTETTVEGPGVAAAPTSPERVDAVGFSEVVKDPAMIFQAAWRRLSALVDGEQNIRLPHEIMFLGGAPGAGKGTMTPYVMWERGITAKPIVMSSVTRQPTKPTGTAVTSTPALVVPNSEML